MKKAIVIGATSGIGKELALVLAHNGYVVGTAGRRKYLLEELYAELPAPSFYRQLDVADTSHAIPELEGLIAEMGGVDLVIVNAGVGFVDSKLAWEKEQETIAVNVMGFAAMVNVAYQHMIKQGTGHLAGISSIAAIRGGSAPAYFASKAFVSNYLQGIRYMLAKKRLPITVTDIQPGFVETAMAQGEGLFWVASPKKAAIQIYEAIQKKKKHVYITKRWRLIAWVLKIMPDFLYNKL